MQRSEKIIGYQLLDKIAAFPSTFQIITEFNTVPMENSLENLSRQFGFTIVNGVYNYSDVNIIGKICTYSESENGLIYISVS